MCARRAVAVGTVPGLPQCAAWATCWTVKRAAKQTARRTAGTDLATVPQPRPPSPDLAARRTWSCYLQIRRTPFPAWAWRSRKCQWQPLR
jgi:hypothetical protein